MYYFPNLEPVCFSMSSSNCCLLTHTLLQKVKSLSCVWLFATPWTVAYYAPPSVGFSRQEYCSGLPFPSPGDLPNPGIESRSPTLQADALLYNTLNTNWLEIGRSPRGGHDNSLQYTCLYNLMDRRTWWATVHKVAKSQTRLKWLSMQSHMVHDSDRFWLNMLTQAIASLVSEEVVITPLDILEYLPKTFIREIMLSYR